MTQSERTRFIILFILLVILVVVGFTVNSFQRKTTVGADVLGVIQNQAQATYKSAGGLDQTSLSNISQLTVSSGVNSLIATYNLGKRKDQNAKFDVQFFNTDSGVLVTAIRDQNGQNGKLKVKAKNIPNGIYDISVKPVGYLSQAKKTISYANGQTVTLEFTEPFKWGDIDSSHASKGDNVVNNADWAILVGKFNEDFPKADFNADGIINNVDASRLLSSWGPPGDQFETDSLIAVPSAPPEL